MADFREAYETTEKNEGGWTIWPIEAGGETYKGVARRWWPGESGVWDMVDAAKRSINEPVPTAGERKTARARSYGNKVDKYIYKNFNSDVVIANFYYKNFWNANHLGELIDQKTANAMYDMTVQHGDGANVIRRSVGLSLKGKNTPLNSKEIQHINSISSSLTIDRLIDERKAYLIQLSHKNMAIKEDLPALLARADRMDRSARTVTQQPIALSVLGHIEMTIRTLSKR